MDYHYRVHRHWMKFETMARPPSEYFKENIYLTFQDDWIAFRYRADLNLRRLMWANDFPHTDSTWPNSQALLARHTADLGEQERDWILHDNVATLYGLEAA
jgi:predicted TIM-barrel fold metal-dependent hydrolase